MRELAASNVANFAATDHQALVSRPLRWRALAAAAGRAYRRRQWRGRADHRLVDRSRATNPLRMLRGRLTSSSRGGATGRCRRRAWAGRGPSEAAWACLRPCRREERRAARHAAHGGGGASGRPCGLASLLGETASSACAARRNDAVEKVCVWVGSKCADAALERDLVQPRLPRAYGLPGGPRLSARRRAVGFDAG